MTGAGANGAAPAPERVTVRMHQVGFGDSLLVSFGYRRALPDGRNERHVLIDFGSTRWPKGRKPAYREIADSVAERTGGQLDAIVITHRHKDHIGGFADKPAADTIAALRPKVVLRPWTEDPTAASNATAPKALGAGSVGHVQSLLAAHEFAEAAMERLPATTRGLRLELRDLAEDQLPNAEAIERIDALANAGRGLYLRAGQRSGLESILPGVGVTVLGPPTVEQWPQVANQRADDPEYWIAHRGLLDRMLLHVGASPTARREAVSVGAAGTEPGPVRWLVERLRDQEVHSLLRIVRTLDEALNNTSLILLFSVGRRRLLFPGDAQIENWSYALTSPTSAKLRADLPNVDLYKVGHHGSRNASPRSLLTQWQPRAGHVTSMMSTLPHVHGETEATAVPRATLVHALEELGDLHRTDTLPAGRLFAEVSSATTTATASF